MKYKKIYQFSFIILLIWCFSFIANSQELYQWTDKNGIRHYSDAPPASPKQTNHKVNKGLFWKIEKNGIKPSYLLGTIHSEDKRVLSLRPEIWKQFDQATIFIMEMKLDHTVFLKMGKAMLFTDGRDLKTIIDQKSYNRIVNTLSSFGFTESMVRPMKPWAVIAILSTPRSKSGQFLDLYLYTKALEQRKRVFGLESAEEQLAVFDTMPMQDQIDLLTATLDQYNRIPEIFEELIITYLKDDLDAIDEVIRKYEATDDKALYQRFMVRLNDKRNVKMIDRMIPHIEKGNSFIAVGALHLNGSSGLIKLLSDQGYRLSPIQKGPRN